jgi:hypothetical protein
LGPDKFFSPRRKMSPKSQLQGPKPGIEEVRLSAESRHALSVTQVVDISSGMAKSCVATDWFSAPCGENRRFSTHLSPLSKLIYRLLRRFCPIFFAGGRGTEKDETRLAAESRHAWRFGATFRATRGDSP